MGLLSQPVDCICQMTDGRSHIASRLLGGMAAATRDGSSGCSSCALACKLVQVAHSGSFDGNLQAFDLSLCPVSCIPGFIGLPSCLHLTTRHASAACGMHVQHSLELAYWLIQFWELQNASRRWKSQHAVML